MLSALEEIIARGQTIARAYADYAGKRADMIAAPFFEVTTTADLIEAFGEAYFADLDVPPDLFLELRSAERALFSLYTLRRAFASQATANAAVTDVFVPGPEPLVAYRVRSGDTLERIAAQFLGDIARTWEVIELNDLVYPFLVADPGATAVGAGVKTAGDVLYLPHDAASAPSAVPQSEMDVELFGRDLALPGGYLSASDSGELATVEGAENLVQALRQRVATMAGELVLHPTYGMEQLLAVGIEGTRANVIVSGLGVARTVLQDPRVVEVRHIEIAFADTVNTAAMLARVIGPAQAEIPLNLVIPQAVQRSSA